MVQQVVQADSQSMCFTSKYVTESCMATDPLTVKIFIHYHLAPTPSDNIILSLGSHSTQGHLKKVDGEVV